MSGKNEIKFNKSDFDVDITKYRKTVIEKKTTTKTTKKTRKKATKAENTSNDINNDEYNEYQEIISQYLDILKEFSDDELLPIKYIRAIMYCNFPKVAARILANYLKTKVIVSSDNVYVIDDLMKVYKKCTGGLTENIKSRVIGLCISLMTDSLAHLTKKLGELPDDIKKEMKNLLRQSFYMNIIQEIFDGLRNDAIIFDDYENKLHFKNGYLKLTENTLKIHPRVVGEDYITKYIKRDFKVPSEQAKKWMIKQLKSIYPKKEERNAALYYVFRSYTGTAIREQVMILMKGRGSGGKSTLMNFARDSTDCYFLKANGEIFAEGNQGLNKMLNDFEDNRQARCINANEPKDTKCDANLIKNLADGTITAIKLYKDGSYSFKLNGLFVITSNKLLKLNLDSGVIRRFITIHHKSEFVDEIQKHRVDNKTIFLKDVDLEHTFACNEDYQNAFIEIIVNQCFKYNNNDPVPLPESFKALKDDLVNDNDNFQDFIDAYIIDTGDEKKDRISKKQMKDKYLEVNKGRFAHQIDVSDSLRDKGFRYSGQERAPGQDKGCFLGYQFKTQYDEKRDEASELTTEQKIHNVKNELYGLEQLQKQKVSKDDFAISIVKKDSINVEFDAMLFEYQNKIKKQKEYMNKSVQRFLDLHKDYDNSKDVIEDIDSDSDFEDEVVSAKNISINVKAMFAKDLFST
jgi:hypothetical protein